MRRARKYKDFFKEAKKHLSRERIKRAKAKAQAEIFAIRLAELRQKQGINQTDVEGFTQSSISKLESRYDMKLSTLLEYLDSIGMKVEILVRPKSGKRGAIPLLKSS